MKTKSFKLEGRGYTGTALDGQIVTWTVPETFAEALAAGADTNGAPYYSTEAAIMATANAQYNIKKGHAISAAIAKLKDGATLSLADAEKLARETVVVERAPRVPGAPRKADPMVEKARELASDLSGKSDEVLAIFVQLGTITQAAADAAKAARKGKK